MAACCKKSTGSLIESAYDAKMDFQQNRSITTLHNLRMRSLEQKEDELRLFSGYRPMELVLPCLYSEIEGPALASIVDYLAGAKYISHSPEASFGKRRP